MEALGFAGPDADAEVIMLCQRLLDDLGVDDMRLEINSIGQPEERAAHRVELIAYLESQRPVLDDDAKRRLHTNPLRILDTKNPPMQALVEAAPQHRSTFSATSRARTSKACRRGCAEPASPFTVNPRLVRGLDYYNLTVFEWITDSLGAQGTVCGGGRYDPLVEMLGGKPTPACGFAMGIERILELMRAERPRGRAVVRRVRGPSGRAARRGSRCSVAEGLRTVGLDVILHCAGAERHRQLQVADEAGRRERRGVRGDPRRRRGRGERGDRQAARSRRRRRQRRASRGDALP